MTEDDAQIFADGPALRRFWLAARGFWHDRKGLAWGLIGALAVCTVLQLAVQYRLNFWNRDFFDALEQRNAVAAWQQAQLLVLLAAASVSLGIFAVWARMTFQRSWREWLSNRLIARWHRSLLHHPSDFVGGERQNAEYRIAEDVRLATDAPIDLVVGLLASVLSGAVFVFVLWEIGGVLDISFAGASVRVSGYLVVAVLVYSLITTSGMIWFGRYMVRVIENKNQAEADFKYALARMHKYPAALPEVTPILARVIRHWRLLCGQHMRTTLVSHLNSLVAPVVGLLLCVPNYVRGQLTLGEVTQAAAAFFAVQAACNWLVDNYPRLAECLSSATRVGNLVGALNRPASAPKSRLAGHLSPFT